MLRCIRTASASIAAVAAALLAAAPGVPAAADTPPTSLTYQGVLTSGGSPVASTVDMTFRLFDDPVGGTQIGPGIVRSVTPDDGVFSESLDFGANAWTANQAVWLEIEVDGDLLGRQPLEGTPYALNTRGLNVATNGNLGINGPADPSARLTVTADDPFFGTIRLMHNEFGPGAELSFDGGLDGGVGIRNVTAGGRTEFFGPSGLTPILSLHNDGFVGVGTASPTERLHVAGGDLRLDHWLRFGDVGENDDEIFLYRFNGPNDVSNLYLRLGEEFDHAPEVTDTFIIQAGAVDVFHFQSNGTAFKPGGGSWAAFSDLRGKRDVKTLEGSLDRVLGLRGVSFFYKDPGAPGAAPGLRTGMVAQEVEKVFPEWVVTRPDGMKAVAFSGFEALAVEALRDLRAEKDRQVRALRDENDALRERLEDLETLVREALAEARGR